MIYVPKTDEVLFSYRSSPKIFTKLEDIDLLKLTAAFGAFSRDFETGGALSLLMLYSVRSLSTLRPEAERSYALVLYFANHNFSRTFEPKTVMIGQCETVEFRDWMFWSIACMLSACHSSPLGLSICGKSQNAKSVRLSVSSLTSLLLFCLLRASTRVFSRRSEEASRGRPADRFPAAIRHHCTAPKNGACRTVARHAGNALSAAY